VIGKILVPIISPPTRHTHTHTHTHTPMIVLVYKAKGRLPE
jgi:hypothetical protein